MRIVTINLPKSYLTAINNLTGNQSIYSSRSELVRVAVREFLIREIVDGKNWIFREPEKREPPKSPDPPLSKPTKTRRIEKSSLPENIQELIR